MENRLQQSERHRFVGEQQWEHEDLETSTYRRYRSEGGERAEGREKFVAVDQWEITELSPERRDLSSMRNAGIRDMGWQVAMLRG